MLSISYSSLADVYALAEEHPEERDGLLKLAEDLEQMGTGTYNGVEYIYRDSGYGMEVVSMEDYLSEQDNEEEDFDD